jgi:hypothetical protein
MVNELQHRDKKQVKEQLDTFDRLEEQQEEAALANLAQLLDDADRALWTAADRALMTALNGSGPALKKRLMLSDPAVDTILDVRRKRCRRLIRELLDVMEMLREPVVTARKMESKDGPDPAITNGTEVGRDEVDRPALSEGVRSHERPDAQRD